MKYNEYTIPVEDIVDEAPMGLVKTGLNKLASKIPGSIGAKATGALQTGGNANAMYKEFYNYLGQKGLKPTTSSISAFLQTKGVSPDIIKKVVVAPAGAQYPQGGGANAAAPAATGNPPAVQTPGASQGGGANAAATAKGGKAPRTPRTQAAPAATTAAAPQQQTATQANAQPEYNTPIDPKGTGAQPEYNAPVTSAPRQAAPRQAAPMPQDAPQPDQRVYKKPGGTGDQPNVPESRHMNEDVRLQKLLSKITKRL